MEEARAYGIIPIYKEEDNTYKLLLIHMYGSGGGTHWTFPKGRPDEGEAPLETALRETKEEVAITPAEVIEDQTFEHSYQFAVDGKEIAKTVGYYIGFVANKEFTIQEEEIKEACWCSYGEALALITYEKNKQLLREVGSYLKGKEIDIS